MNCKYVNIYKSIGGWNYFTYFDKVFFIECYVQKVGEKGF